MRIGFDISQTAESKAGCGFFADQMVQALARLYSKNSYELYPVFYDYSPETPKNATQVKSRNFVTSTKNAYDFFEGTVGDVDIIHSNNFRYPFGICSKKIVTVYDVCFLEYPEYTTEANRLFCYYGVFDSMLHADKIIAISEYTKKRLMHFFPMVNEKKIEVVYCGNRDTLLREKNNIEILRKYNLEDTGYFLSVGTIEPRKNYHTLLQAYAEYKKKTKNCRKLCIAGGYGWMEENFNDEISHLNLENDVTVTGYVSDEELSNLYRYSYAFIYPSWYEGFGLPVLEAMNFKKPVIASDVTSIPEITGKAAVLINPNHCEAITEAMLLLENNGDIYKKLAEDGHKRTELFSWNQSAKRLIEIYEEMMM